MNSTIIELIRPLALFVLTPKCFDTYLIEFDFFDGPCFSTSLSKALGLGIILGSILVKLPQILKIHQNKSGEGISIFSVTLDLIAINIYSSYSFVKQFPFSAWGDSAFVGLQTLIVGILVLFYNGSLLFAGIYFILDVLATFILITFLPPNILWTLQGCNIFIVLAGKLQQAYVNYKNGNTGQLSGITLFLLFAGSLARIFTSIQETGDNIVILTYIAASIANAILFGQLLYYWNVKIDSKIKKNQ